MMVNILRQQCGHNSKVPLSLQPIKQNVLLIINPNIKSAGIGGNLCAREAHNTQ